VPTTKRRKRRRREGRVGRVTYYSLGGRGHAFEDA